MVHLLVLLLTGEFQDVGKGTDVSEAPVQIQQFRVTLGYWLFYFLSVEPGILDSHQLHVPNHGSKEVNGRLHEKIALLVYPGPVQIEHDRGRTLVAIQYLRHAGWNEGVATVRILDVVEIDHVEFGNDQFSLGIPPPSSWVLPNGLLVGIICFKGKRWVFEVIDVGGVTLPNRLPNRRHQNGE